MTKDKAKVYNDCRVFIFNKDEKEDIFAGEISCSQDATEINVLVNEERLTFTILKTQNKEELPMTEHVDIQKILWETHLDRIEERLATIRKRMNEKGFNTPTVTMVQVQLETIVDIVSSIFNRVKP